MRKDETQTGLGLPRVTKWIKVARTGFEPKAVFLTTPHKCGMAKKHMSSDLSRRSRF